MVEKFEKFLSSRKSRYLLGVVGVGVAMGLGVLGAPASSSSGQLSLPQTYNVSKEKVGAKDVTLGIDFFSNNATKRANYTASADLAAKNILRLRLENGRWNGTYGDTALCKSEDNSTVAKYHMLTDNNTAIAYELSSPISKGGQYYFAKHNGTHCNDTITANVTIPQGTTSDVKVIVELGNNKDAEAPLIYIKDQWSISKIESAKAYINATNNTLFVTNKGVKVNNETSANATITISNATELSNNAFAHKFNATLALDKFPSWLNNVTSGTNACDSFTLNSTNYNGTSVSNCINGTVTLTFNIKGNETLTPTKIALSKFDITKVDGENYSKNLLNTYSGDKTLLEVLYDGLVVYIPRFDHRREGNPKTFVNLATTRSDAKVRVCKFAGDCYSNEISLDKDVKNLFQRDPAIENFLNGYSGALRLEFINVSDPSQLVCYTVFVRADGTVVRVPCLVGSGVEEGAKSR